MSLLKVITDHRQFDLTSGALTTGTSGLSTYTFSEFSRRYVEIPDGGSGWGRINVVDQSEVYAKGVTYRTGGNVVAGRFDMLFTGATGNIARVACQASGTTMHVELWNGSAWVSQGSFTVTQSTRMTFCLHVKIGVAGRLRFWDGTTLVADYSGDTSALGNVTRVFFGCAINSAVNRWSEMMVANHNIQQARLKHHLLSAGAVNEWTGAVADVNDLSDGTFLSSGTAAQKATFAVDALPASSLIPAAVIVGGRFRKNATGPTGINLVKAIGGSDYETAVPSLSDALDFAEEIMAVSPATSAPWTIAEIEAMQVGVKSVA